MFCMLTEGMHLILIYAVSQNDAMQVVQVAQQSVHSLQNCKISKWDARMWVRFVARLGVLGAAL